MLTPNKHIMCAVYPFELYSNFLRPHRCSRTACIHAAIAAAILRRLCWRCKAAAALMSCVEDRQVLMTCLQDKG